MLHIGVVGSRLDDPLHPYPPVVLSGHATNQDGKPTPLDFLGVLVNQFVDLRGKFGVFQPSPDRASRHTDTFGDLLLGLPAVRQHFGCING